jgi:hypothetical protein
MDGRDGFFCREFGWWDLAAQDVGPVDLRDVADAVSQHPEFDRFRDGGPSLQPAARMASWAFTGLADHHIRSTRPQQRSICCAKILCHPPGQFFLWSYSYDQARLGNGRIANIAENFVQPEAHVAGQRRELHIPQYER